MSGFWTETCTISRWTKTIGTDRQISRTLNTQVADVPCQYQPDVSGEVQFQRQQMGLAGGKLYYDPSYTIDVDDTITVRGSQFRVSGPPVYASGAQSAWVPLEREIP